MHRDPAVEGERPPGRERVEATMACRIARHPCARRWVAAREAMRLGHGGFQQIAAITGYLQETISGVRIVRAFGQEERHKGRLAELNGVPAEAHHEHRVIAAWWRPPTPNPSDNVIACIFNSRADPG